MTVLGTPAAARAAAGSAGLALAVLSAATFGTSGTFASALIGAGWSPGAAVLTRIGVAALILTVPAVIQLRGRWALLRRNARSVAAYSLLAIAAPQLCFFNAVARIPVGVAMLLEYLGVVLVVGWLWLRHGQRPRRLTVAGGTVAIAGLAMVLDLAGPGRDQPGRRGVGAARRRRARELLPALGGRRAGAAAAHRHGVGRDVRRHGRPGRRGLDRVAADDRQHGRRPRASATG